MADPLLHVWDISKTYRGGRQAPQRPALSGARFDLTRGEILGIVGESGSGKTTLARCVALLERPDKGQVVFRGRDLVTLGTRELRRERRAIQTVFQDPFASLNPLIRVGDALAEVMLVHGLATRRQARSRVIDLLGRVGLPPSAFEAFPREFSGGQRQRICIARALAAEPDILIADEPVSSLDVSVQAQVVNLILDLRDELGLSVIFIGHDLQLIDFIAPRMLVMLGGEIIETIGEGCSLAEASHEYTRALIAAVPDLGGTFANGAETTGMTDD